MIRYLIAKWLLPTSYLRAYFASHHDIARDAVVNSRKYLVVERVVAPEHGVPYGVIYATRPMNVVFENPEIPDSDVFMIAGDNICLTGGPRHESHRMVVRVQAERIQ